MHSVCRASRGGTLSHLPAPRLRQAGRMGEGRGEGPCSVSSSLCTASEVPPREGTRPACSCRPGPLTRRRSLMTSCIISIRKHPPICYCSPSSPARCDRVVPRRRTGKIIVAQHNHPSRARGRTSILDPALVAGRAVLLALRQAGPHIVCACGRPLFSGGRSGRKHRLPIPARRSPPLGQTVGTSFGRLAD